jgi:excinuclease ABC A subunit
VTAACAGDALRLNNMKGATLTITVIGAREHNLRNVDVSIPRNALTVITGLSGSGKSSLAFDTIFAEGQREFLESLSSYARRNLPKINPPNVTAIEGMSPCILIDQDPLAGNPRSTIGTVTEIYTFLRLLYSRMGKPIISAGEFSFNNPSGACERCKGLGFEMVPDLDRLLDRDKSLAEGAILHRTWCVESRYWNIIRATELFDMDKPVKDFSQKELDTLLYSPPVQYQNDSPGYIQTFSFEGMITRLHKRQSDSRGLEGNSYDKQFFTSSNCRECRGARINARAREVMVNGRSIVDLVTMEVSDLVRYIETFEGPVAASIVPFMRKRLQYLVDAGVGYLSLSRSVATLSNGESQRVKLARQMGSSLTELIYILDEPTAGLHVKDVVHLSRVLRDLVNKPNTVIVVEHDKLLMQSADHIIDMGPGAGVYGGKVIAQGTPEEVARCGSPTGQYLSGKLRISARSGRRSARGYLEISHATLHNLKDISVRLPKNVLTCISGVSGSGKSSLIEVLLRRYPGIVVVDQTPIGATPRSNPATYVKAFDDMRKEFAQATKQNPSLFTFNGEGACEVCQGLGYQSMDMHFLGDVRQVCEECGGTRYKDIALHHHYKGKSIADVLDMTITEAVTFFATSAIKQKLGILAEVGLGYLRLGQPIDTLSGGESQRVKLASRLGIKGDTYVLDEPTRGLHFADIDKLLQTLNRLVDVGNTVIVVEHNLDVLWNADWIVDLGPDGGKSGGRIVAEGTPESVASCATSYTGRFLAELVSESRMC